MSSVNKSTVLQSLTKLDGHTRSANIEFKKKSINTLMYGFICNCLSLQ